MNRAPWLLALVLLLTPGVSQAIQLHWSTGADTLTFTEATRCMLVVQADSAEVALPPEWRLLWAGDSTEVTVVALDSVEVCAEDTAQVHAVDGPSTPADSTAHRVTAHFCSGGSAASARATYVLDLPGWGRGKFKVIALDPKDSSTVIESNEVTFNGGVNDPYPLVVLRATSVHQSLQLRVTAIGCGLEAVNSFSIIAPDSSWSLPLSITARSDGSMTGVASVAALLPTCRASVGAESGAASTAFLPADEEPTTLGTLGCHAEYFEDLLAPPPGHGYAIQPKDFAFTRGFVDASSNRYALHLFYIRHSYWNISDDANERNLGHTWTTDFDSWEGPGGLNKPDTVALTVRPGKFDELHVWAPTIVQYGPTFHMFYTGVKKDNNGRAHQRIGVATSTDLLTWTPEDAVVLSAPDVSWASKDPLDYGHAQQLRDPFVIEDPTSTKLQWLMYFVAVDSLRAPKMAVGVARSSDLRTWVADAVPLLSTERSTSQGATTIVESPHVFRRNGQWWLPYTVNFDHVFFETTASADPTDANVDHWAGPVLLRDVAEGQPSELQYWHASEYLGVNSTQYLAAFNDNATSIDIKGMFATSVPADSFLLSCPSIAGVTDGDPPAKEVRMSVSRRGWGAPDVGLRLELPSRVPVRLAVYDIAGRRRSTILDRELPAGVTELVWDGRDQAGSRMASGMYFIRLTCTKGARVSKIVMLR